MSLRRSIEGLGPYPSLLLSALPIATVEPLKLAAVALAGKGHWITGTAMIAACYAFSLLIVERLFVIVKPKLLSISWFARLWEGFVFARARLWQVLKHWIGLRPDRGSSALPTAQAHRPVLRPTVSPEMSRKSTLPKRLQPMLASLTDAPFDDPGWVFEDKYDGFRMVSDTRGNAALSTAAPAPSSSHPGRRPH
nr:hypothetical protein [Bradyrhizobium elkanii]